MPEFTILNLKFLIYVVVTITASFSCKIPFVHTNILNKPEAMREHPEVRGVRCTEEAFLLPT